jgi:hypothetical protein|tara:strand:+ start:183 stop:380 length:198 start_codon:yes stop_codon:yes gene_type:complete
MVGVLSYEEMRLRQQELELKAAVALLQAAQHVGPNTIEDCIAKLDRIAFPEDYIEEFDDKQTRLQ